MAHHSQHGHFENDIEQVQNYPVLPAFNESLVLSRLPSFFP